jgi:F-box-like
MYAEPPTHLSLADARRAFECQRHAHAQITTKINQSKAALQQIVADSKCVINNLESERAALEDQIFQTMAYLSPIRRLPFELLRQIFLFNFDDYPCCAWVLCAVCSLWRKTALSMPQIWSKVHTHTPLPPMPQT